MPTIKLTTEEFKQKIFNYTKETDWKYNGPLPAIVDFYADWCGPCKQTAPEYSRVAATYSKPGVCAVAKYNLDKIDPSEKGNIHGIPVFQFFVNGKQVDEIVGADIPRVEETLKSLLI